MAHSSRECKMYNRILVPIDGSDASNSALKEAITLAKDQHSTLRLFHVVDLTVTYSSVQAPHMPEHHLDQWRFGVAVAKASDPQHPDRLQHSLRSSRQRLRRK